MPQQLTFAQAEYQSKKKTTRRDRFLAEMEQVVPWTALLETLAPHYYPNAGRGAGRPPIGLERMLRMYFLQQWFGLSDEGVEDTIYDSQAFRAFLGIDLGRESVPDATTLLKFRRLLEDNDLARRIFDTVNRTLSVRRRVDEFTGRRQQSSLRQPRPRTSRRTFPRWATPAKASSGTSGPKRTSVPTPIRDWCTASNSPPPTLPT